MGEVYKDYNVFMKFYNLQERLIRLLMDIIIMDKDSGLLSIIGSYKDTLTTEETIELLEDFVEYKNINK